jgi:2-oxo-3-hexenedioate decarboxylase
MLADELIELHRAPRETVPFSERYPGLTPQEGYAAARALHAERLARGWQPLGRKIGFTNRTIWPRYGVYEPIWGRVYDRTLQLAAGNAAVVPLEGLVQPRIEPEICFKLRAAPRGADPRALLDAIEWIAHAIEIVQCHHPAWKVKLADCTADNGLHGRLVVGEAFPPSQALADALPGAQIALLKEERVVDRGVGANVLDGPLQALGHLVKLLVHEDEKLQAGEIVTTGTLTDAHPVAPGESWSTRFSSVPLPGLRVEFR